MAHPPDDYYYWKTYRFQVYESSADIPTDPGVYVLSLVRSLNESNMYYLDILNRCQDKDRVPVYIGQAESLRNRVHNKHHRHWETCIKFGHIHVLIVRDENRRKQIERELIQYYFPTLNKQNKFP